MNLVSIDNISKSYGEKLLFSQVSLGIDEGDKIGVIGINGTGKSSFLNIVARLEPPDTGRVICGNKVRIEYLPQNPLFNDNETVIQQVFKGDSTEMVLLREYEYVMEKLNNNPGDHIWQEKLINLGQKIDSINAWQIESEAKTVLTRLGIGDFDAIVGKLSGGQKKRIALARALITPSDLLIMDEPTNHIDNATVDWLEQYLNKRKGAVLLVTHDRYFLDRIVTRIIELDKGRMFSYSGNYSTFLELKLEREQLEHSLERKRQNILRNELAWIRRGARARSTKQKARIERFEKLQEKTPLPDTEKIELSAGSTRLGKKVIELQHISKSFAGKDFINDLSYIVQRHDRVGIIGPNGIGKTTLLNIMAGRLNPDSGIVETGSTVRIGFYCQENKEIDENLKVIEYIKEAAEFIKDEEGKLISASQMLERFLFPPDKQWASIARLSGGEKRRLYLLRILVEAPNVLLLDEPTNDLDTETLAILEDYLDGFPGAVITVSHDRYFLDKVVEKILVFEDNGVITQYTGNYSQYLESAAAQSLPPDDKKENTIKINSTEKKPEQKVAIPRFTFKEKKEYEEIDGIIEQVEKQLAEINTKINEAASDYEALQELVVVQQELQKRLEELMERWVYLNDLAEKIANYKKN